MLFLHHARHCNFVFAFFDGLAFVVFLFASCDSDDELGKSAVVDEKSERDDCKSCFFAVFFELCDFFLVEQQFAVATGYVVVVGAVEVFCNVHVFYPHFAFVNVAKCVDERCFALSDGFDFGAGEHDSGCVGVADGVVKRSTAVFYVDVF